MYDIARSKPHNDCAKERGHKHRLRFYSFYHACFVIAPIGWKLGEGKDLFLEDISIQKSKKGYENFVVVVLVLFLGGDAVIPEVYLTGTDC
jgi:hypothetical protein